MKITLYLLTFLMFSCTYGESQESRSKHWNKKQSIESNKRFSRQEIRTIKKMAERNNWPMTNSGSGAHFWIYEPGPDANSKPQVGDLVEVKMTVSLPNGDTCYSHERYGSEQFRVNYDNTESGLHEIIQKTPFGSKVKIILPSNLAFGVSGDANKIPPNSIVIYDLELLRKIAK